MQVPSFLPDNLGEWLSAIVIVASFLVAVYRYGRNTKGFEDKVAALDKKLEERLERHGERIGRVEFQFRFTIVDLNADPDDDPIFDTEDYPFVVAYDCLVP